MHTFFGVLVGRRLAEDRAYSQQFEQFRAVARIQCASPLQSTTLKGTANHIVRVLHCSINNNLGLGIKSNPLASAC
jgi:hypothetical protein